MMERQEAKTTVFEVNLGKVGLIIYLVGFQKGPSFLFFESIQGWDINLVMLLTKGNCSTVVGFLLLDGEKMLGFAVLLIISMLLSRCLQLVLSALI